MATSGRLKVAIVGAGIAGLTLAAALRDTDVSCTIYEKSHTLQGAGAGIQLAPNASRHLHRLGLTSRLIERGTRVEAAEVRGWAGNPIARTPFGDDCEALFGAPYYAIHRAHLQAELLDLVGGTGQVRRGHHLQRVSRDSGGIALEFTTGGRRHVDLVVGADGVHSGVRSLLVQDTPTSSGLDAYRALVPTGVLPAGARLPLVRSWLGPGRHVVCYPVAGGDLLNVVAVAPSTDVPSESWTTWGNPADLVAAFTGWHTPVQLLTQAISALGPVRRWSLHDRDPLPEVTTAGVALIGDAAHPMLPFLGQGANQAIEDAAELGRCLGTYGGTDLSEALTRYSCSRKEQAATVQQASRHHAREMHLPDGEQQRGRDRRMRDSSPLIARTWLYQPHAARRATA